ncbi:phenylacetic acid degradation bifunctional protein PaaZ [Brachybacterium vulturis]|uniref:Phenylacetic acid degradation bifunctional protein PaaZ n=2 Tax=Brachybacterium vulturis TaxID=2017484 RepID=A0A291GJZ0_9MICO|nr:phenylacetic acid degradation bifunctional protein PaaZ [Brachybacterium vulturis]ATG50515.1 phenylacetic acid degradation bifunctional protein PaaZ [Brachybacterium vulturis]
MSTQTSMPTAAAHDAVDAPVVPSYVRDGWWLPAEDSRLAVVADASTGEPVARFGAEGLDLGEVVEHARTVGRRTLGEMSLHERALRLKELAKHLFGQREELYEITVSSGVTTKDNLVDVDGGIGTLFTYSSKGRRELPNSNVVTEGPIEQLSADGSFLGGHVLTRIPGVAAQINAFNFPVWGMLEKFAPAFIAGVPTLVKPATPTGYITAAAVRMMVESGLLPDGSLQLISGSARGLLDVLDHRDMLSFTGSADTAGALRSHPHVVHGGVRFTAEADSLNAAVLGPDATEGTPEFDAFIRAVVTEMTVKAGQKCTAIRRVIVPEAQREAVTAALGRRIRDKVVLGDPRAAGVTMGALASRDQLRDVRGAVEEMLAAGGRIAHGALETPVVRTLSGEDATADEGAFLAPIVLTWEDPGAEAVHSREAFGPVTSVLGYRDLDDAVRLAARGGGSLVATVCTHDPDTARELTVGIAGHHGRVHLLDRDTARSSTGHGAAMPQLVHGGPGRAGGGEELGGTRAVKHHMQRTAVQGSPDLLTAVTGLWHTGAAQRLAGDPEFGGSAEEIHPFRKSLAELRLGDGVASGLRTVSEEEISAFAQTTGDTFYAHTDPEAAAANPFFPGIVAHGYLLVSWGAGLFVDPAPGPVLANYGLEDLRFLTPVAVGDSIRITLTAKRITPRVTDEHGEVRWDAVIHNQDGEVVATYDVLTLVEKENTTYAGWNA